MSEWVCRQKCERAAPNQIHCTYLPPPSNLSIILIFVKFSQWRRFKNETFGNSLTSFLTELLCDRESVVSNISESLIPVIRLLPTCTHSILFLVEDVNGDVKVGLGIHSLISSLHQQKNTFFNRKNSPRATIYTLP